MAILSYLSSVEVLLLSLTHSVLYILYLAISDSALISDSFLVATVLGCYL